MQLASGEVRQVTEVVTGVSGVTQTSPALSVAAATGTVAFTIRRAELNVGFTRFDFGGERQTFVFDPQGLLVDRQRTELDMPPSLNLGEISLAIAEDNSYFGFTAPVRGWRARYEVSQTIGSVGYTQALFDHRRYFSPFQSLTIAVRGMHVGRYGLSGQDHPLIRPFYVGWESLLRGYSTRSFDVQECTITGNGGCPEFDRLRGHRIAVANIEARIPLLGFERFGLIEFPLLPTELVAFADAGVAWNAGEGADLRFERRTDARVPVFSTGVSARFNILGALIVEAYWAYPWQRPEKGGHFGFHFAPGW